MRKREMWEWVRECVWNGFGGSFWTCGFIITQRVEYESLVECGNFRVNSQSGNKPTNIRFNFIHATLATKIL